MTAIMHILIIWLALQIPCGILVGRFLKGRAEPEPIETSEEWLARHKFRRWA